MTDWKNAFVMVNVSQDTSPEFIHRYWELADYLEENGFEFEDISFTRCFPPKERKTNRISLPNINALSEKGRKNSVIIEFREYLERFVQNHKGSIHLLDISKHISAVKEFEERLSAFDTSTQTEDQDAGK